MLRPTFGSVVLLVAACSALGASLNVSTCPGYTLSALSETQNGFTAHLDLAGPACNAFGTDIANLTIQVTYETQTRLHVNLFDTANSQFTVPDSVISLPGASSSSSANTSDLIFNYEASPFEFWITRRSDPDAFPLFDTRKASLPATPIPPVMKDDASTALDGFALVFEDQYLQLTSALPLDANVYGLGEVVATSGFRRDVGTNGGGTIQTNWDRDDPDPTDENIYGSHPIYMEHRFNNATKVSQSHGVFLVSPAPADILLLTPPSSATSLIQYRLIGGTISLYFLSGPSPISVTQQYAALIGTPTWQPYWGFGFHLCRYGYKSIDDVREVVRTMREKGIPLETQWTDIDLYHAYRDFTTDPVTWPLEQVADFIRELRENNQHFIPIVDAGIAVEANSSDVYVPYRKGTELDVYIKNPDGSEYIGQVWPGFTVFADWFAPNAAAWWAEALKNWSQTGVEFSGIWLDMNEADSFCEGSCGSSSRRKRGIGAGNQTGVDLNNPPYAIHNGFGRLGVHDIAPNATHFGGYVELDVHNLWGLMEAEATHKALQEIIPGQRPFIISRSTFPSAGKWTGHWLGDNFSRWSYLYYSIQGILQFQLFQIPFVGADTCGFNENTSEELCNRWMQLGAFTPFYRNHAEKGTIRQEPYLWESVTEASKVAMDVRYRMLPYWYTLFANSSTDGTPPVRALFWEFPEEQELFANDRQFLIGRDILVTPVLTEGATTVDGTFPGRGNSIWRDWYTHDVVNATIGGNTTLAAPLGHIPVHIRDGAAILLHAAPAYSVEETKEGPFSLLISQSADGAAFGTAFLDDGISDPPGPSTTVKFQATKGGVDIASQGEWNVTQKLVQVTILGVAPAPGSVSVGGVSHNFTYTEAQQELVLTDLDIDLNGGTQIVWE
ncbi:glycoside hydrolase family 31 protein [Favolaschia claudopus]|uniref:alpha-glucosidase n=1 Tax=Favolaschia claudopus TaxID=2862362 RepID=A0AAW0D2B5_9AGAR